MTKPKEPQPVEVETTKGRTHFGEPPDPDDEGGKVGEVSIDPADFDKKP